jgi:hydroxymethylbilane synthase
MTKTIRIGSRKSRLALAQSDFIRRSIEVDSRFRCEIIELDTRGDKILDRSLPSIGGKGLFTQELEERLIDGSIDLAVHSLKDLPTDLPEPLILGAVSAREDPRDAFLSRGGVPFSKLPAGARLATGSLRRRAQLLRRRPDLDISDLRGNVPTRIQKLENGNLDGIVLAHAGLLRLGLEPRVTELFEVDEMVPAPGQGALGIEVRAERGDLKDALRIVHDDRSALATEAERGILGGLGGGCNIPLGVHAVVDGRAMTVFVFLATPDGERAIRDSMSAPVGKREALISGLTARLLSNGARAIIESIRPGDH